ncbi:glycoside hydrolase family 16 protein [Verrucomicrobiaceae bacterium 227]
MKFLLLPLLTLPLMGQVKLTPAVTIEAATKEGSFYQLEVEKNGKWLPVGDPIIGDGKPVSQTHPLSADSKVRLNELKKQWVPVWQDEFNGNSLDRSKWAHEVNSYGGGNNERQYYSDSPKNTVVSDGKLQLKLFREPFTTVDGKTQPYTSSRIRSMYRGDWKYGKFEIRAKMPGGQGIWPAAWMLPTNSPYGIWAACGEIDIIESHGTDVDQTFGTLHFGGQWPDNTHKGAIYRFPKKNAAEDFHVYGVEWSKDEISWFLDGKKWQTIKKEDWNSAAAPDSATAPFDQPFHMILNLAADGGFFKDPNNGSTDQNSDNIPDSEFPQVFEIDYVRVFQWAD